MTTTSPNTQRYSVTCDHCGETVWVSSTRKGEHHTLDLSAWRIHIRECRTP